MSCPHQLGAAGMKLEPIDDPSSESNLELFLTQHVDFDWKVDFDAKVVSGCVKLHLMPMDFFASCRDNLRLDIKDINVSRIHINNEPVEFTVDAGSYPNLGNVLSIKVGLQTSRFVVVIEYCTMPQSSALQWLDAQMTADKRQPFLFTQCQAIHARSLFPCQDTPRVKFTFSASVLAPPEVTVLMGAHRSTPSGHCDEPEKPSIHYFHQDIPIPSYLVALACGELDHARIGQRSFVWAEPSVLPWAKAEFEGVDDMIAAAESLCGDYEWGVYDILVLPPSFPYGGMENPCLTFVTPCLLAGDKSLTSVIAHEIAHSWTGNLVTNANWEHFWLNEGHTKYVEGLILERLYGTDYRELFIELGYEELLVCLEEFKEGHPLAKMVPCLKGIHTDDAFSIVPYQKGSLFLYFLENKYGKAAVLSWLKSYISHFRRHSLSTRVWIEFMAAHLGKNILQEIDWNTWLYHAGSIPWVPRTNRKLSSVVDKVAERIKNTPLGSDAESAAYVRGQYETMLPLQRQLLWRRLLKCVPLSHDNLLVLNNMLAVSTSKNAEIRFLWSLIVLYSQYLPGVDGALEFLNSQGRMKYTRPIYKALVAWPSIKQQAINNYKANKQYMHPTTAKLVEKDIELSP
ncbi:leukotriene A 4 hydrolase [Echinococcus multilocularis]|uniref:Leukotriene A 4 hydrolase n=1 Tax=Echinococcus multilocularis TaxID=6211 RepID=A0A068YFE2_ECHMU|nr:leukotriene A 4 hydrolase [Echinococcus multilocularis]